MNKKKLISGDRRLGRLRDCPLAFQSKSDMKKHIIAVHHRNYRCKLCEQVFETSITLECHLMEHEADKPYKCDLCGKSFYTKWRLGKHLKQHESFDAQFCHYFNNGKFCPFEEHGCMFRHEHAQFFSKNEKCRITLCQFKHQTVQAQQVKIQKRLLKMLF